MRVFFDSSAFAKRFLAESGSTAVLDLCSKASIVVLSNLAPIEILSAMSRLRREGALPPSSYREMKRELARDIAEVEIVDVSNHVIKLAIHALERAPLRTLDAVQLASAVSAKCDLFVSADKKQLIAAQVFRIKVQAV